MKTTLIATISIIILFPTLSLAMAQELPNSSSSADYEQQIPPLEDPYSYCPRLGEFAKNPKWSLSSSAGQPDQIVVDKARRLLHVLSNYQLIRTYKVALGKGGPTGPKREAGDNKTPEGKYFIEYKNSASDYHLSLRISYPNAADIDYARKHNVDPGGDIMIHGLPNSAFKRAFIRHPKDWTRGCVAVTDNEIEEMFEIVDQGTPIELCK